MLRLLSEEASLKGLHFADCSDLTDAAVKKVLVDCRNLDFLVLKFCDLLTPDVFKVYVASGSKAELVVVSCKHVRPEMLPEDLRVTGKVTVQ